MSGSPLSFATIPGFETMCSPVRHEARVRCVWRESEKLETPGVHTADFSYMYMRKQEYSTRFGRHSNGGSKSCPKARSLCLHQTRRNPGRRLARGRAAVSDRYSMQTSQCKLLSSARSSPSRPPAAHKSFPLGRASRSSAIRFMSWLNLRARLDQGIRKLHHSPFTR